MGLTRVVESSVKDSEERKLYRSLFESEIRDQVFRSRIRSDYSTSIVDNIYVDHRDYRNDEGFCEDCNDTNNEEDRYEDHNNVGDGNESVSNYTDEDSQDSQDELYSGSGSEIRSIEDSYLNHRDRDYFLYSLGTADSDNESSFDTSSISTETSVNRGRSQFKEYQMFLDKISQQSWLR